MASDDEIRALATLALRHKTLIELSFEIIKDIATMVVPQFQKCMTDGCNEPATVRQADMDICVCDGHAARAICRAQEHVRQSVTSDGLDMLRVHLANEELWFDLPNATRIRRLKDYVDAVNRNDEPEPANQTELH
jgi:hypothetical protein